MKLLLSLTITSLIAGCLQFLLPRKLKLSHRLFLVISASLIFVLSLILFASRNYFNESNRIFFLDPLSALFALCVGFFGLVISVYSVNYFDNDFDFKNFSSYFLFTLFGAFGVLFVKNIIGFIVFWGIIAFTLYLLINLSKGAEETAKKAFTIVGGADLSLMLGFAVLYANGAGSLIGLHSDTAGIKAIAFLLIALAAFAKAGAMPLHSWVPDTAEKASVPVSALLPASIDKLIGIYLITRLVTDIFLPSTFATIFLMLSGAVTIVFAVMMAMVQHNMKRLLGYHAVSQVGYMIIGIATATPLGIIGGLFHMINHVIYKTALFLTSGSVEKKTNTAELDKLGGLSKIMPFTFVSALISAMAISGIPPLNGFVSKWIIYNELVRSFSGKYPLVLIFVLVCAMIGSALTLASFVKLIHSVYLANPKPDTEKINDSSPMMLVPMLILSLMSVVFGLFAFKLVIPAIAYAINFTLPENISSILFWQPGTATMLTFAGIAAGLVLYFFISKKTAFRYDDAFTGGEKQDPSGFPSGIQFYRTIEQWNIFTRIYKLAQKKAFDIYDVSARISRVMANSLSRIHSGDINLYLLWTLIGIVLFIWITIY